MTRPVIRLPDELLGRLLGEDLPYGDLTTATLGIGSRPGRLWFEARAAMVVCGTEEAARLFELTGAVVTALTALSGQTVPAGAPLLAVSGPAAALHAAWKVAQNLVEYASGIASAAARLVAAALLEWRRSLSGKGPVDREGARQRLAGAMDAAVAAVGRTPPLLVNDRQNRAFYQKMWRLLRRNGHWQGEIWNRRQGGEIYPMWLTITAVTDAAGNSRAASLALTIDSIAPNAPAAVLSAASNSSASVAACSPNTASSQ